MIIGWTLPLKKLQLYIKLTYFFCRSVKNQQTNLVWFSSGRVLVELKTEPLTFVFFLLNIG